MTAAASAAPLPEVLLIDLSSLYWTAWHATKDAPVSDAANLSESAVRRCITTVGGQPLVAICCDSGSSFRKDLAPSYKATREEKAPAAIGELKRLQERLREQGYLLWTAPKFEADDIIATAAHAASKAGHPVCIASADKDLLQLLALPDSRALSTMKFTFLKPIDVVHKFGVEPDGLRDWLALVGDTSDNVEGCDKVGKVTATNLLLKHFDIDGIYRKIDALEGRTRGPQATEIATPAVLDSLIANKAKVELARTLVTLRTDVPIVFEDIYTNRTPAVKRYEDMSDSELFGDPSASISKGPGPTPITVAATPIVDKGPMPPSVAQAKADFASAAPAAEPTPDVKPAQAEATYAAPGPRPSEPPPPQTRALVPVQQFETALEPWDMASAFALARALYDSRLYMKFPNWQGVAAVMMRGREMGLPALVSLDCFHVIEGKPSPIAHLVAAEIIKDPDCEYLTLLHSDDNYAEYEMKHRRLSKPVTHRYTIQEAIDAGLATKEIVPRDWSEKVDRRSNWDKRRKGQLRKTCVVEIGRIWFPGRALGLYSAEEMEEVRG